GAGAAADRGPRALGLPRLLQLRVGEALAPRYRGAGGGVRAVRHGGGRLSAPGPRGGVTSAIGRPPTDVGEITRFIPWVFAVPLLVRLAEGAPANEATAAAPRIIMF